MTTTSDIAGLSERLNDAEGVGACLSGDPQFIKALCKEAATALDSLSARVKELERSRSYQKDRAVAAKAARGRIAEGVRHWKERALRAERAALQGWRTIDSAPQDRPIALLSIQPQQNGGYHITMDVCQWRDGTFEIGHKFRTGVGHGCATHWCEVNDLRLPPLTAASDGEVG